MKVRVQTPPPDQLDLEQLQEMLASDPWVRYRERLKDMEQQLRAELATATTWEQTLRLQGQILSITRVAELPEILIGEIRAKRKPS